MFFHYINAPFDYFDTPTDNARRKLDLKKIAFHNSRISTIVSSFPIASSVSYKLEISNHFFISFDNLRELYYFLYSFSARLFSIPFEDREDFPLHVIDTAFNSRGLHYSSPLFSLVIVE